jgi:hypothetical protein
VEDLGGAAKAEASGTAVTLKDNVELAKNVTVPDGVTLTVGAGKTLTVPQGITLTVTGTLNGVGPTSKLVLGAGVTVGDLATGTYVWHHAAWFDETDYTAATAAATTLAAALGGTGKAVVDTTDLTKVNVIGTDAAASGETATPTPVPLNVTLVVQSEKVLTVASGKALSVAGTLNVAGALNVESGGKYAFEATGTGTSTGTITVKNGGEVLSVPGSDMGGTGYTVVEYGGKAYSGASWESNAAFVSTANDNGFAVIKLTSGSVSTNNYGYVLDGVATVYGTPASNSQGNFTVGETADASNSANKNDRLVLKAGSVLTVPGDNVSNNKHILLVVTNSSSSLPGVTGEPGNGSDKAAAQIVLQEYGYIDVYDTDTSGLGPGDYSSTIDNLPHNFYTSDGTKITANGLRNKTFNWDANAGGNGTAGWKEATVE